MLKSIIAALAVSLFAAPLAGADEADEPVSEVAAVRANQVIARVNGMVCDFCAQAVISMFGKDEAVETVEVDLDNGEIRVALKEDQDISDERVEDLVTKSGYDLVEIIRPAT